MSLSHTRIHALLQGQTGLAQKLFWAVPIEEPWTAGQIAAEYGRTSGGAPAINVVEGVLRTLVDAGLVKRTDKFHYMKDPIKPKRPYNKEKEPKMFVASNPTPLPAASPTPAPSAFDMMAALAVDMRAMAQRVEEIALRAEQEAQTNAAAADKLHALQALLKGL